MSFLLQPLQIIFAVLSESIRKEQERVIEYLQLENQILREKIIGKRVLLQENQRRLLAVKGKAVGRSQLPNPTKVRLTSSATEQTYPLPWERKSGSGG